MEVHYDIHQLTQQEAQDLMNALSVCEVTMPGLVPIVNKLHQEGLRATKEAKDRYKVKDKEESQGLPKAPDPFDTAVS